MKKTINLLLVGVGGQGIVLASDIIGDVAISSGLDIKKTDTLGMAQRGGSVVSHIRIASKVYSPLIKEGTVDLLVAFEKLEAARWGSYLNNNSLAIINNYSIPPVSVSLGYSHYPEDFSINKTLQQRTDKIYFVDGSQKAIELGDMRVVNMFMLGCIASLLTMDTSIWLRCISQRLSPNILKMNLMAFNQGREVISSVSIT
jgi:indolepyruvate ferredoxin oxidoreductase beta subunit